MARDFTKDAGATYMSLGLGTVGGIVNGSAYVSMHCWVNVDTISGGANDNVILDFIVGADLRAGCLAINGSGGTKVLRVGGRSGSADASLQTKDATSSFTTGTWHSCGGVLDFGGDTITPYFNGTAEGGGAVTFTNSTFTDSSTSRTLSDAIGAAYAPAPVDAFQVDGRIAEVCIWFGSRALIASEFVSLSKGVSPKLIAPALGRIYFPLIGRGSNERDYIQGLTGTITGTISAAAHPRIYYPSAQILQFPPTAAPVGLAANPIYGGGTAAHPLRGYIAS